MYDKKVRIAYCTHIQKYGSLCIFVIKFTIVKKNYLPYAKQVIETECDALTYLSQNLTESFNEAVDEILHSKGKVIVLGVGKSGIIGRKIAATLASTGTSAFFIHPTEAFHGDLGMIQPQDILLMISYSGETEEVLRVVPAVAHQQNKLIAFTGNPHSTLAQHAHHHLNIGIPKEACPLELAPTSSTTATLALGDALAVALMYARDFQPEDFARSHPGGSLGRRLLTTVATVMVKQDLPIVSENASMKALIHVITKGKLGLAVVLDDAQSILGIITDGDLRRAMEAHENQFFTLTASDIMTQNPQKVSPHLNLARAEEWMTEKRINNLLVEEAGKLVGVVQLYSVSR